MSLTRSPRHTLADFSTDTRVLLTCRWYSTPLWKIRARRRTNKALELAKLTRECRVNDWAAVLRTQGYDIPVGSLLCGERVTR
jgi:hypothetical protein